MTYIARREGTALDGEVGISTDRSELHGHCESDVLVARGGGGGRVLVLGNSSNLGVDGSLVAENGLQTDLASVSLKSTEEDGVGLSSDITSSLGIGESLVSNDLLEAIEVVNIRGTGSSGSIAEQCKDGVLDLKRIVQLKSSVDGAEDSLMGVLLRNLTLGESTGEQGQLTSGS